MSRPDVCWFRLRFPSQVDPEQVEGLLRALHGLSNQLRREVWSFQTVARNRHIEHYLAVPARLRRAAEQHVASAVPGLRLEEVVRPDVPAAKGGWRVWCSTSRRPLRREQPELTARTLLSSLTGVGAGEVVSLQWVLGPVRRPIIVTTNHPGVLSESWPRALALASVLGPHPLDNEERRALREKQSIPGWRAVGRITVSAGSAERGRGLLRQVAGALRVAEGPGAAFGVRSLPRSWADGLQVPWRWGLALSVSELTGLIAWPLGPELGGLPVSRRRARLLPVPADVRHVGRVLAVESGTDRPLALSTSDSRVHLWAMGPTGVGKSTLLTHLIEQDMAAGRSVVVIEPKGDLIADVLARVPAERRDDVVLLDPPDPAPVGLNPLLGGSPELVADQLLSMLGGLHEASWGPRLAEILHTALLTLARTPGMSLPLLPPLLTNSGFRRRIVNRLNDPLGVTPIWQAFDAMSDDGRAQVTASVLNKIRPLVGRPDLRAVLGQAKPRFQLQDIFTERKVLLVDLAKGAIGPDSAKLLGTLVLNQIWQATLARSAVPADRRHLVTLVVDEFQDFAGLPGDFGDILAQARGLGLSFTLAHQHLKQLPEKLQAAVLANARNRVIFQTDSRDATVLSNGHAEISPADFTALPAYEAYLRLSVDGAVTPYMSGQTLPPSEPVSEPATIRRRSRERHGQERGVTDRALTEQVEGQRSAGPVIGSRRRAS